MGITTGVTDRLDHWRGAILLVTVVLCPVAWSFRLYSFLHAKELVLVIGLTLLAVLALLNNPRPGLGLGAFLPLWLFVLLMAAVHLLMSPAQVPAYVAVDLARAALLLLLPALTFDLLQRPPWPRRLIDALILSAVPVAVLGLLQYAGLIPFLFPAFPGYTQRAYSVFGNQDLFGGYLAIIFPLALAQLLRRRRPPLSLVALPLLVAGILISGSRAAWLAAVVGTLLLTPLALRRPRRSLTVTAALVLTAAATVAIAPEATLGRLNSALRSADIGYQARLWFWDGAARMIRDHPILGIGPGNFAYWSPSYLAESLSANPQRFHNDLHAVHAESEPLEIVAETGVAGLVLCLWMLLKLLRRRGVEWSALAALLTYAALSFPFRSAPHALAGLVLAALLLARPQGVGERDHPKPGLSRYARRTPNIERASSALRTPHSALSSLALLLCLFFIYSTLVPSALQRAAENAHLAGRPSLQLYERALRWPWPNYEAQARYAFALLDAGRPAESEAQLLQARRGFDTADVYYALAAASALTSDHDKAHHWLKECLYRNPSSEQAKQLLNALPR